LITRQAPWSARRSSVLAFHNSAYYLFGGTDNAPDTPVAHEVWHCPVGDLREGWRKVSTLGPWLRGEGLVVVPLAEKMLVIGGRCAWFRRRNFDPLWSTFDHFFLLFVVSVPNSGFRLFMYIYICGKAVWG